MTPVHYVLSGSFRSLSLFLLAFEPRHRTLQLVQTVHAFGPHQYLATNPRKDRIYTTSWALPPVLSSWSFDEHSRRLVHLNNVPITATSSYITIPPPYTHAYSAGGPTGEVHTLDPTSGALGAKIQQFLFVNEDELDRADKSRAALRYGSHGIEFSASGYAFVPVLGTDCIEMYTRDLSTGVLEHKTSVASTGVLEHKTSVASTGVLEHKTSVPSTGVLELPSPHAHDGPRHVKIHPNGRVLYCVTEHSNLIDVYTITPAGLSHLASRSLLPSTLPLNTSSFRGDTLLLSPSTPAHPAPHALFATTRGANTSTRGWLSVFRLDEDGLFADGDEYWETPTSGGKANALDVLAKDQGHSEGVWILLTDDDDAAAGERGAGVRVLEWDGWGTGGVRIVAGWPRPGEGEMMQGGSHAVWLD